MEMAETTVGGVRHCHSYMIMLANRKVLMFRKWKPVYKDMAEYWKQGRSDHRRNLEYTDEVRLIVI